MMRALVILAPVIGASVALVIPVRAVRRWVRIVAASIAAVLPLELLGREDPLAWSMLALVSFIGFLATLFSVGRYGHEAGSASVEWSRKAVYFWLLGAFWSAMALAVLATDFATLWIAISATTLATALLVGFEGEADSLEAAWKYLVLCSAGIAFGLLGIMLLGRAAIAAGLTPAAALSWHALAAAGLTSGQARVGLALMIVGFGTKAGLVPLHAWLPDAHSKAPAPVSGMLSGLLVSCALYALMRTMQAAGDVSSAHLLHGISIWLGAASIVMGGLFMITQRDLKRLLAYSTIEHAGVVTLALGIGGPIGRLAAVIHLFSHACAKSGAFLAAGILQADRGTTELARLRGSWQSGLGGRLLFFGGIALAGMPPFGPFVGELLLLVAAVVRRTWIPLGAASLGLFLAFLALARVIGETSAGDRHDDGARVGVPMRRYRRVVMAVATSCALAGALAVAVVPWTSARTYVVHLSDVLKGGTR
jgi:hydrogenase-4 component F